MLREIAKDKVKPISIIPDGEYRVIYADPPWKYSDKKEYRPEGSAENHYPVISIMELCQMDPRQAGIQLLCRESNITFTKWFILKTSFYNIGKLFPN